MGGDACHTNPGSLRNASGVASSSALCLRHIYGWKHAMAGSVGQCVMGGVGGGGDGDKHRLRRGRWGYPS